MNICLTVNNIKWILYPDGMSMQQQMNTLCLDVQWVHAELQYQIQQGFIGVQLYSVNPQCRLKQITTRGFYSDAACTQEIPDFRITSCGTILNYTYGLKLDHHIYTWLGVGDNKDIIWTEFPSLQFIHTLLCDKQRDHHSIHQVVVEGFEMLRLELGHCPGRIKYIRLCWHDYGLFLSAVDHLLWRKKSMVGIGCTIWSITNWQA